MLYPQLHPTPSRTLNAIPPDRRQPTPDREERIAQNEMAKKTPNHEVLSRRW